jgi:hypothetical protein
MTHNGPAVVVVSVTRRSIRAGSRYFRQKVITVQGGYGTCFCNPGTKYNRSRLIVKVILIIIASRSESCKNRDKLITPTVRVSKSAVFFIMHDLLKGLDPFLSLGRNYHLESFDYNFSDCTNCQVTENIEDDG